MSHTTITQWPGDKDITPEIHEAIWDWQQRANEPTPGDEEALIDDAHAIFEKIGTRESPADVAERCGVSIEQARKVIQDAADRTAAVQAKRRRS